MIRPDSADRESAFGTRSPLSNCRKYFLCGASLLLSFGALLPAAYANPVGPTVRQGAATFSSQGSQLTIRPSDQTFINWQSFNIGLGETTTFIQPSSSSLVWNRINDSNPSQILGNLNANGYIVLQNQSGFYIGGQAAITAHGLLMTTAPIQIPDLSGGGPWQFNAPPPSAKIINYGHLDIGKGGSAFLISHDIENHGSIVAPEGEIGLYAGKQVLLSQRPDGRGLSAQVTLPQGSVNNTGELIADAGTIAMHAQVVNQGGLLQANSVREANGVIELVASDAINLGPKSVIQAKGDIQGASPGGAVMIKSSGSFGDTRGSLLDVSGGAQGGNGGRLEVSAASLDGIHSTVAAHAASGFSGGRLLIDPFDLTLDSAFVSSLTPILAGGLYGIDLQADNNITLSTVWNLTDPGAAALLTLTAGNSIILNNNSGIKAGNNWSVNFSAGPQNLSSRPDSGNDGIYLNGNSFIETRNGNITLWAANDILVNASLSRFPGNNGIRTVAGGSINVTAEYGSVNTGASQFINGKVLTFANVNGFMFGQNAAPYYRVSPTPGGISTAAGGNVAITAGGDVISFAPIQTGDPADYASAKLDGGTGAFGSLPGNVTISAGGNVFGHYVLANGVGAITAGGNIGVPLKNSDGTTTDATRSFALSLIKGSWDVHAPNGSIYVQDVRNPNGIFGERSSANNKYAGYHVFDYDPLASVLFQAGDSVEITGGNAPHLPATGRASIPLIFPPTLQVITGPGGFVMDQSVTLFPSPNGNLDITTPGNFSGVPNFNSRSTLSMADGGSTLWDLGSRPITSSYNTPGIEINNPKPVEITVGGTFQNVDMLTTKTTHVTVGGDMIDVGFNAQNLHSSDVSSIKVTGKIYNTPGLTFVPITAPLQSANPLRPDDWTSFFFLAVDPGVINFDTRSGLGGRTVAQYITEHRLFGFLPNFVYDPKTLRLGFNGDMSGLSPQEISALESPVTVVVLDQNGNPIINPNTGRIQTKTYTFITSSTTYNPIADLQQASKGAPPDARANSGYLVGGGGQFNINAASMNLGNTVGVETTGGAAINLNLTGDLTMLTSRIASFAGGNVTVNSLAGSLDLGTQNLFIPNTGDAYGIYTSGRSDVRVVAHGNVNIDGSRIAAYNGGNVYVESSYGNVNAGSGGNSYVNVPLAGGAYGSDQIYGSGILAVSLPRGFRTPGGGSLPGNITINTPRGDIISSQAGILQIALDGNVSGGPTVTLTAGTPASGGSPAIPGNILLGSSGLIGGTVNVTAQGNIEGLIVSRQNSTINAALNFSGTLLSAGTANVAAGGVVSGTVIGVGGVSASGARVDATLLSQNVSVGGGQSQSTLGSSATATATSQAASQQANSDAKEQVSGDTTKEDDLKKKGNRPALVRHVGRVTVILPKG
jgi:filamentous hemagglutinin family protein